MIQDTKNEEYSELANYLIANLQAVTPNFEMPFCPSSWADRIGEIEYPSTDIRLSIDWLFSGSGRWFLKNVPDAWHFKKHFKTINDQRKKAFFEDTEESLILQIQALEKRLQELREKR